MKNLFQTNEDSQGKRWNRKIFVLNKWYHYLMRIFIIYLLATSLAIPIYYGTKSVYNFQNNKNKTSPPKLVLSLNLTEYANVSKYDWFSNEIILQFDCDNDSINEIITSIMFISEGGKTRESIVLALDPLEDSILWTFKTKTLVYPPSIVDSNRDGIPELIINYSENGLNEGLCALNVNNGSILWKRYYVSYFRYYYVLTDIEGDGNYEIVLSSTDYGHIRIYNASNGDFLWSSEDIFKDTDIDRIFSNPPAIADLDNDGIKDIIAVSNYNNIYALNSLSNSILWEFKKKYWNVYPPVVGDLNNDYKLEVVFGSYDGFVYALDGIDGSLLWKYNTNSRLGIVQSPSLGDINSDGIIDVIVSDFDNIIHAIDGASGRRLWVFSVENIYSSPTIGDFDGDKRLDVIIKTEEKIRAIKGSNGKLLWSIPLDSYPISIRVPIFMVDVDTTKDMEIITLEDKKSTNDTFLNIYDFESEKYCHSYWNPLGGYIGRTNSLEAVDRDNDGLSNNYENYIGTNNCVTDTDSDHLPDWYEHFWTNTDPTLEDSDSNGLSDKDEDLDGDSLTNYEELMIGTKPLAWDTDKDLLKDDFDPFPLSPDGWIYYGTFLIIFIFITAKIFLRRKRKGNVTPYFICESCAHSSKEVDIIYCPECGKRSK
ncbi:MAG: FG-GAP-like repeat-containing protein [Candidatus Heimdallarchaeaceae archaeon]